MIKPLACSVAAVALVGCTTLNILKGPDDFCRSTYADFPAGFENSIARELRKEPPQGALTQPYSREAWSKYWNDRIFYVWTVGPDACNGTYRGPSGPELVEGALARRRAAGLPDIELESRNRDKPL